MTTESKQAERPWFVGMEPECDGEQLSDGQIVGGYTGRDVYDGRIYTVGPVRTGPGDQDFEDDAIEIARVYDQSDAEQIVRAVNAHKDLLGALVDLSERAEQIREDAGEFEPAPFSPGLLAKARAAIAKAEGRAQ